jgi:DNA-binding transcriptional ArsR family regulator
MPLADDHADLVAEVLRMLADATPVQLLSALISGECPVNDLALRVDKPAPSVSQHGAEHELTHAIPKLGSVVVHAYPTHTIPVG